jgi:hypothetical protein
VAGDHVGRSSSSDVIENRTGCGSIKSNRSDRCCSGAAEVTWADGVNVVRKLCTQRRTVSVTIEGLLPRNILSVPSR